MSNINQDLQATHKILTIIEQSKSNNDELLDHLPGIFCIIDDEARILRGNLELANIFKIDLEDLIEKDFSSIFNKEIWNIFKKNLDSLSSKDNKELQFELEISNDDEGESRSFYWYISPFSSGKDSSKSFSPIDPMILPIPSRISGSQFSRVSLKIVFSKSCPDNSLLSKRYSVNWEY